MSKPSLPTTLADRLRAKLESDQLAIEVLMREKLSKQGLAFEEILKSVLNSTEAAFLDGASAVAKRFTTQIDTHLTGSILRLRRLNSRTEATVTALKRLTLIAAFVMLLITTVSIAASVVTVLVMRQKYLVQTELKSLKQQLFSLKRQISGMELLETPQGSFLLLPTESNSNWKCGSRQCLKLPEQKE